jgi:hypothetical protein
MGLMGEKYGMKGSKQRILEEKNGPYLDLSIFSANSHFVRIFAVYCNRFDGRWQPISKPQSVNGEISHDARDLLLF